MAQDIPVRVQKGIPESCKDVVSATVLDLVRSASVRPCLPGMARCRLITHCGQQLLVSYDPHKHEANVRLWKEVSDYNPSNN
jgi:hypothetical protein